MRKDIISEKELIQEFCKCISKNLKNAGYVKGVHLLSNLLKIWWKENTGCPVKLI